MSLLKLNDAADRDPAVRQAMQDILRERIGAASVGAPAMSSGAIGGDSPGAMVAGGDGDGNLRQAMIEGLAQEQAQRSQNPDFLGASASPPGAGAPSPSGAPVMNFIGAPASGGAAPTAAPAPGMGVRGPGNPFDDLAGQVPQAPQAMPSFPRIMTLPEWAAANHPDLAQSTMMPKGVKDEMLRQYDRYLATADFMQRSRVGQQRAQIALDNQSMGRIKTLASLEGLAQQRADGKIGDTDFVEGLRQSAAQEAASGEQGPATAAYKSFLTNESAGKRRPDTDGIEDNDYVEELEQAAAQEVGEAGNSDGTAATKLRLYRDLLRGPQSRGQDRGRPLPDAVRTDMIESIRDFGDSMGSEKSKLAPDVLWQRIERMQRILATHGGEADLDNIKRLVEAIKPDPSSILRAYQGGRFGKKNKPETKERVVKLLQRLYPGIAGGAAEKLLDGDAGK